MISEISGVIGVDSITDYYDVNIKYERLKEIESLDRDWTFVRASIADKDAIERIFSENKISVVVNFAGPGRCPLQYHQS